LSEWAEQRIERRPTALGAVVVVQRRRQIGPEHLEVHHRRERLELVADIAQPPQPLVKIKKPRLFRHSRLRSEFGESESRRQRAGG
jgi:hypothetical protein